VGEPSERLKGETEKIGPNLGILWKGEGSLREDPLPKEERSRKGGHFGELIKRQIYRISGGEKELEEGKVGQARRKKTNY